MGKPNRGRVTGEYGYAGFFTYPQAKPYVLKGTRGIIHNIHIFHDFYPQYPQCNCVDYSCNELIYP